MPPITLTLAHSPDPDDTFMWWPLGDTGDVTGSPREPSIDTGPYRFTSVPADIHELNVRAVEHADLDITALSMYALSRVTDRYLLCSCGSSMGDGYGPKLVARQPLSGGAAPAADLLRQALPPTAVIAVPGERTSAFLALRLLLGRDFGFEVLRFDLIAQALADGRFDAGIVIHESQLTYQSYGLHLLADLGAWWKSDTGLPLPLGANAIRADLNDRCGPGSVRRIAALLRRSVDHALANRAAGLAVAKASALLDHAHATTDDEQTDRFVSMYVTDLTLDLGPVGRRAVELFFARGQAQGLLTLPAPLRII